jgi:iron complex transport system ATP-binding protein
MLEVKEVFSGYGEGDVIKGVSFNLRKGEFVALIGPNGAGKTTLLRTLSGTLPTREGEIIYEGKKVQQIKRKDFAKEVAMLPQHFHIPFSFIVKDFLLLGRYPHTSAFGFGRDDEKIVHWVAEQVGVQTLLGKRLEQLSGGQRQRVFLAQALCQQPSLLFLDEPVQHLDIHHRVEVLELLKRLNEEEGLTVLCVLHDLNLAALYFDRLILLSEGRVLADGKVDDVLHYRKVEEAYKTVVVVGREPIAKRPHIFLVPGCARG